MKINVPHIAELANLPLTEEETTKFEEQLSGVLKHIEKLSELDTTNVKPTSQVTGLENVMRDDKTKDSLTQEEALSNARSSQNGSVQVVGILDAE